MLTRKKRSEQRGFTIIEVVIIVAIVGVLLAIGITLIPRERFALNQAAEVMARDYQFVRLEAIRRNEFVGLEVQPGSDSYRIYVDMNRNFAFDENDLVVKVVNLADNGISLAGTEGSTLYFDPRGLNPNSFVGELAGRLSASSGSLERFVCVNTQGHTRIEQGGCA